MNPSFRARFTTFIVPNEASVSHQPTKRPFHNPPLGQHGESLNVVGTLYDLDLECGPAFLYPLGECLPGISAVNPQFSQLRKPTGHLAEHLLRSLSFRATGWSHLNPEH